MAPLREVIAGDMRPILLVLLGGAGLLLLIANVNVAGLLLVRSESRKREIAVRTALGASSGRLIGQFVTEALVLIAAGSALGLVSAHWAMQLLAKLIPEDVAANMPFLNSLGLNPRVAAFAGAISLLTAALFSFAPSLRIWSPDVREDLAEGGRGSAGTVWSRLGSKLVVMELSAAMVLLVSAGLLGKSLYRMLQVDVGLQPDHLATIEVVAPKSSYGTDAKAIALAREMVSGSRSLPGVKSTGVVTNGLPSKAMETRLGSAYRAGPITASTKRHPNGMSAPATLQPWVRLCSKAATSLRPRMRLSLAWRSSIVRSRGNISTEKIPWASTLLIWRHRPCSRKSLALWRTSGKARWMPRFRRSSISRLTRTPIIISAWWLARRRPSGRFSRSCPPR